MSKDEKKKKPASEEYHQIENEYMDNLKKQRLAFIKTGIVTLAALVVVIFASIAWLINNGKVNMGGTSLQSSEGNFEIAAAGRTSDTGTFDSKLDSATGIDAMIGGKNYVTTGGGHASIYWAITSDSNMENVGTSGIGISPGSKGQITFYIIAKKTETLTVNLNLSLIGLGSKDGKAVELEDVAAKKLLAGHVLLFAGYNETEKSYSGWISEDAEPWTIELTDEAYSEGAVLSRLEDGSLTWTADVTENTAYPVTIYWIWPEVLGEYIFKDQAHIGDRPVLFPEDAVEDNPETGNPAVIPQDLFGKMCDTSTASDIVSLSQRCNRYFLWDATGTEFTDFVTVDALNNMRGGNFNTIIYGKVCSYYNMADQYLGDEVRYVELKLDAQ